MKFSFVCPDRGKVFESLDFRILENRGIVTDAAGTRYLDAKVVLDQPCPYCGEKHVYNADELSCPYESPENEGESKKEGIDE